MFGNNNHNTLLDQRTSDSQRKAFEDNHERGLVGAPSYKSYGGVRYHKNKTLPQSTHNYNQRQFQKNNQQNIPVVVGFKYKKRMHSKKKHKTHTNTNQEELTDYCKSYVKWFRANKIGDPVTGYQDYLTDVCDHLIEREDLNKEDYLITTQKYLNFFSSEMLLRGNRLSYLVYLEMCQYLDGMNLSYHEMTY